jgi:hypothetical protein
LEGLTLVGEECGIHWEVRKAFREASLEDEVSGAVRGLRESSFEPHQPPSHLESVNEFKERMEESLSEAKVALAKAKDNMSMYYNHQHEPAPTFAPGEKVYLNASVIYITHPSQKLAHQ